MNECYKKLKKQFKLELIGMILVMTVFNMILLYKVKNDILILAIFLEIYILFQAYNYYFNLKNDYLNDLKRLENKFDEVDKERQLKMMFVMDAMEYFREL